MITKVGQGDVLPYLMLTTGAQAARDCFREWISEKAIQEGATLNDIDNDRGRIDVDGHLIITIQIRNQPSGAFVIPAGCWRWIDQN